MERAGTIVFLADWRVAKALEQSATSMDEAIALGRAARRFRRKHLERGLQPCASMLVGGM